PELPVENNGDDPDGQQNPGSQEGKSPDHIPRGVEQYEKEYLPQEPQNKNHQSLPGASPRHWSYVKKSRQHTNRHSENHKQGQTMNLKVTQRSLVGRNVIEQVGPRGCSHGIHRVPKAEDTHDHEPDQR